jgi:hypothetical protein
MVHTPGGGGGIKERQTGWGEGGKVGTKQCGGGGTGRDEMKEGKWKGKGVTAGKMAKRLAHLEW